MATRTLLHERHLRRTRPVLLGCMVLFWAMIACGSAIAQPWWSVLQPYPVARTGRASVLLGDMVYLRGGDAGTTHCGTLHGVMVGIGNSWIPLASSGVPREFSAAAEGGNGKIYSFGGYIYGSSSPTKLVEAYDPLTDTWSTGVSLSIPRSDHGATAYSFLTFSGKRILVSGIKQS